jgi:hypothetical protein
MHKADPGTLRRTIQSFSGLVILCLIVLCGVDHVKAQSQWTTNGNNINNTNSGNVGVGTTTPSFKLDVIGSINAAGALCLQGDCRFTWASVAGTPSQWGNGIGGTNIFYLGGNVGIGANNPQKKLHISGANSQLFLDRPANTAGNYALVNFGTFGADKFLIGMNADAGAGVDKLSIIETAVSATVPVMTVTGGNIGVGTTTPSSKFHVAGEVRSSTGGFRFPDGTLQTTAAVGGGGTISAVNAGTGLSGGGTSGAVTLTNTDPGSSQSIFKNIANAAGAAQFAAGSNNDSLRFAATGGATVTFDGAAKKITITNTDPGSTQSIFKNIANAAGSTQFSAASNNDSLRFAGSGGTTVTFDGATKKITIDATGSTASAANISSGQFGQNTGGGNYTFPGNVTVSGNIAAKYQDVAEWVPASHAMSAGTVVVLDSTQSNQVTASTQRYDSRVAGVISSQPGLVLGEEAAGRVLVATTGRVKVKVDASNGPIQIGDLLVTSDKEGVAMKSRPVMLGGVPIHRPGTLIGKALEPLAKGRKGEILVLLSLQ